MTFFEMRHLMFITMCGIVLCLISLILFDSFASLSTTKSPSFRNEITERGGKRIFPTLHTANNAYTNKYCEYSEGLTSQRLVWSHRAINEGRYGAKALRDLLLAGIRNFDIDVSVVSVVSGASDAADTASTGSSNAGTAAAVSAPPVFLVAHPKELAAAGSNTSAFQTVQQFIEQIEHHMRSSSARGSGTYNVAPEFFITIEPKFLDPLLLELLWKTVYSFRIAEQHIAAVSSNAVVVNSVDKFNPRYVAVAYKADFQWNDSSSSSNSSAVGKQTKQHHDKKQHPVLAKMTKSRFTIAMPSLEQLIETAAATAAVAVDASAPTYNNDKNMIVTWIVDSPERLDTAMMNGADGIVTNCPVAMLTHVRDWLTSHCNPQL